MLGTFHVGVFRHRKVVWGGGHPAKSPNPARLTTELRGCILLYHCWVRRSPGTRRSPRRCLLRAELHFLANVAQINARTVGNIDGPRALCSPIFASIAARTPERLWVKAMRAISRTTRILARSPAKLAIETRCLRLSLRRDQPSTFSE